LDFLRDALMLGPGGAVERAGGAAMLKHLSAGERDEIVLRFEHEGTVWEIRPRLAGPGVQLPMAEQLQVDGKVVIDQKPGAATMRVGDTTLVPSDKSSGFVQAVQTAPHKLPLPIRLGKLGYYALYHDHQLLQLRRIGSAVSAEVNLEATGVNLFAILQNWQAGERKHRQRIEFVRRGVADAFPELFEDIDFEKAGQTVTARFYTPGFSQPFPIYLAPNGLLIALLHLAAVASVPDGGAVAIDEFENSLHPHAIRLLVDAIRRRAAERDLTVILASHSPVVLNLFRDDASHAFVIQRGESPRRIDELHDPEWLSQFSLGDLYANEDIGAPSRSAAEPSKPAAT
jgi:predicted ATPase